MRTGLRLIPFILLFPLLCAPTPVFGASASLDPTDFTNAATLIADTAVKAVIKTVGLAGDYRTFQSVSGPSGFFGLDVGASVMVSQVPPEFLDVMETAGYTKPEYAALPAPHLRASRRLLDFLSVDAGYAKYKGFGLMGAGAQVFTRLDEGPDFGFRLSYSRNNLGIVKTETITPSFMVGKRLSFFEPYLAVGYQMTNGTVTIPLSYGGYSFTAEAKAKVNSLTAYGGLVMNFLLLQIVFEGNYSAASMSGVGVKVGIRL